MKRSIRQSAARLRGSVALLLLVMATAYGQPARGVTLQDFENASAVVVGRMHEVQRLDPYTYTAVLRVERVVEGVAPGPPMRLLWEQPLPGRPPSFFDHEDVLVAVDPVAPGTFGEAEIDSDAQASVFQIAAEGEAFLRLPDPQSLYLLTSYLALSRQQRQDPIGLTALVRMTAAATLRLRRAALHRLGGIADLDERLSPDARAMLMLVVSDENQPLAVRRAVLDLIGRRKLLRFRDDLVALLAKRSTVEPEVLGAIARMDGRLPVELAEPALDAQRPQVRVAAVRYAPVDWIDARLPDILRSDPSPEVRAAAARALARRGGKDALRLAMEGLWDVDTVVRSATARALGRRGTLAVSLLGDVAWSPSRMAAEAAILGLAVGGESGRAILGDIAARHPSADLRQLAWLAILRF